MHFSKALPKTSELWSNIVKQTDTLKHYHEKTKLENELQSIKDKMQSVETMDVYYQLEEQKEMLREKIIEQEILIRTQAVRKNTALKEDVPKLAETYNEEFKQFHKEYCELDRKLKAEGEKFAKAALPLLERMSEIERLETDSHSLKIFGNSEVNRYSDYLKLPVRKNAFRQEDFLFASRGLTARKEWNAVQTLKRIAKQLLNLK